MSKKRTIWIMICAFLVGTVAPYSTQAQPVIQSLGLPAPGQVVALSGTYNPVLMHGIKIFPDDPFRFDFIINTGQEAMTDEVLRKEAQRLIKYFLTSLTVPEDELWVNLSPYEKDRVVSDHLGITDMGRDLLAQDYLLKNITSSLMNPEHALGQEFWSRVHQRAQALYGVTDLPVESLHKVWIVPDEAVVYVHEDVAYVLKSTLKVMLEVDYLAMQALGATGRSPVQEEANQASEIIREIIIPELEREVNHGKHFVKLRQIYHSLILATWFKKALKESILGKRYVDQNKIMGIDIEDKDANDKLYQQYLKAFQDGVYNLIREDYDPQSQQVITRRYFSGGMDMALLGKQTDAAMTVVKDLDPAMLGLLRKTMTLMSAAFVIVSAGLTVVPEQAEAVHFEETKLTFEDNNTYYGYPSATGDILDINMNELLQEYLRSNGGILIPDKDRRMENFAQFMKGFDASSSNLTFDDVSAAISFKLNGEYKKAQKGLLDADGLKQLAQLELEAAKWLISFFTHSSFPSIADNNLMRSLKRHAMFRVVVGKEKDILEGARTYNCSSLSDLMVLFAREIGLRNLTRVIVLVGKNGKQYKYAYDPKIGPDAKEGHIMNLLKTSDGKYYFFDQSINPIESELIVIALADKATGNKVIKLGKADIERYEDEYGGETWEDLSDLYAVLNESAQIIDAIVDNEESVEGVDPGSAFEAYLELLGSLEILYKKYNKTLNKFKALKEDLDPIINNYLLSYIMRAKTRQLEKRFNAIKEVFIEQEKYNDALTELHGLLSDANDALDDFSSSKYQSLPDGGEYLSDIKEKIRSIKLLIQQITPLLIGNSAEVVKDSDSVGGIDLTPVTSNLGITGEGYHFDVSQDGIYNEALENFSGFSPIILQIQNAPNIPLLLGIMME
jgi:hypothetical protein